MNEVSQSIYKKKVDDLENGSGVVTLDYIVDSQGNKRFIGGNGTPGNVPGMTIASSKWVLNGTNLIFEILGSFSNNLRSNEVISSFTLPDWISNKIVPVLNNTVTLMKVDLYFTSGGETVTSINVYKSGNILYFSALSNLTVDRQTFFNIRYNIIIDSE